MGCGRRGAIISAALVIGLACARSGGEGDAGSTSSDGAPGTTTSTSGTTTSSTSSDSESDASESGSEGESCSDGELGDDQNCGACGVACTVHDLYAFGEYGGCEAGACKPTWSPCFTEADGLANCAAACASFGEQCAALGCGDGPAYTALAFVTADACEGFENPQDAWFGTIACDEAPTLGGGAGRCCCTDTP